MRTLEAHCHWRWSHDQLEVYLIGSDRVKPVGDSVVQVRSLGLPIQMEVMDDNDVGAPPPSPTFTLTPDSAQQFMDALWQVGLRPTEGTGSAGSLAATEKHLNDMRAIVSKQLGVPI